MKAMGLIFDDLLGLSESELRRLVNLYAVLYSELVVSDSWLMTNAALQKILQKPDGLELLRNGVILPARRSTAGSFTEFLAQARAKKMHALCAEDGYVAMLDREAASPLVFEMSVVGQSYKDMSVRVLEEEFLVKCGVKPDQAAIVKKTFDDAKAVGTDTGTNTFVKNVICAELTREASELVMEIARAPYSLNLPKVLGTGIVGPQGFRGDRILALLEGKDQAVGAVEVGSDGPFKLTIDNGLVQWFVTEALNDLSAEELVAARSTSLRWTYLGSLALYLKEPTSEHWSKLAAQLEPYLVEAASEVFRLRKQKITASTGPGNGTVEVEGDQNVRVLIPDQPVMLNAFGGDGSSVKIVGRTYQL